MGAICLGKHLCLNQFIDIVRRHAKVEFSATYRNRVNASRALVEKMGWMKKKVMYGVTTGFGALCTKPSIRRKRPSSRPISSFPIRHLWGRPLSEEVVRGTLLMMLQNLGQGYSGVRLCVLEQIRQCLNLGVIPWAPGEGSVGYLSPEAHMALVLTGRGKAWSGGELLSGAEALKKVGLSPLELSSKEGLALVSGTTSPTAMAAIALYDFLKAARTADVIGAMSVEALEGVMNAFDERVMSVRPHLDQGKTAENVRNFLADSAVIKKAAGSRVQDALSLRCIPQLHGAAKKTLNDALVSIETEINSCCDNPIIWPGKKDADVISACNPDSSYVGLAMDSSVIAATMLAKMSERRNNRLIDGSLSGHPWFLIKKSGP